MSSAPLATKGATAVFPEEVWERAGSLPCFLSIDLPLQRFTVRDLLRLATGDVLESGSASGAHVPVTVNKRLIGWAEFEVVGQRLAVRITELA